MNNREAHYYLEELQRMMTEHRGIFSEEFVHANGMAILALEKPEITLESAIDYLHSIGWMQEHDRILTESEQPEPHYDEWCESCKEYDQEKHCCPRWNKVIRQTLMDARPEKFGHWIDTGSGQECSECGEIQYGYDTGRHFCANCGAYMGGAQNE